MRTVMMAAIVASVAQVGGALADSGSLTGVWLTENSDSKIRMTPCGKAFCGTVIWAKTNDLDVHNPDPALRRRSIVGMPLTTNMKPNGDGRWAGSIYNPENGKTYSVTMQQKSTSQLEVEGCVLGVLCGSDTWSRQPDETASAAPNTVQRR